MLKKYTYTRSNCNSKLVAAAELRLRVSLLAIVVLLHLFQLLQALSVRSSNKVSLHIKNTAIWVHKVLLLLALDLDHSHHHAINHIN